MHGNTDFPVRLLLLTATLTIVRTKQKNKKKQKGSKAKEIPRSFEDSFSTPFNLDCDYLQDEISKLKMFACNPIVKIWAYKRV